MSSDDTHCIIRTLMLNTARHAVRGNEGVLVHERRLMQRSPPASNVHQNLLSRSGVFCLVFFLPHADCFHAIDADVVLSPMEQKAIDKDINT